MANETFSVKPILRTDKKKVNGTCPINYLVTINSKHTKLRSGDFCEQENWNRVKGCFKGSPSSFENGALENDVASIKDFLREQKSLKKPINTQTVQDWWATNDTDDFYELYDKACVKKFKKLREGTQYHYDLLRKRLKQYKTTIRISDLDLKFIDGFDAFMRNNLKIGDSGIDNRHKNLKAILSYSVKAGLIRVNPYVDFDRQTPPEPEIEILLPAELRLLEKIAFSKFPYSKGLELSRDKYLFSNYTGLRFSDVDLLSKDKIVDPNNLYLKTQKTQKWQHVPLSVKAKKIIQKYLSADRDLIFPKRTNVSVNRDLKKIASMCKIKKNVRFHLARHTYATTLVNDNINPFIIMNLLGHSDIRTTQRYVNNNANDLSKAVNSIRAFN